MAVPPVSFSYAQENPLVAAAKALENKLNEAEQKLSQDAPKTQAASIPRLQKLIDKVTELQNIVQKTPMDPADIESVSDRLYNCVLVFNRLNGLQVTITLFQDLVYLVNMAKQTRNQQELTSLSQRVSVEGANPRYNQGLKKALNELQANIQDALQGNGHQNPTIQPAIPSSLDELMQAVVLYGQQNQGTQTHTSTAYPTSSASTSATSRDELEKQAALARISELKKQFL
jgi:hypothetical protein